MVFWFLHLFIRFLNQIWDANCEELLDKINTKEPKLDTENINILENEIIKIKRFVMTERMTKNNVNECKEKIANFRNVIKKMKMKSNNETILVRIIEEIIEKLDKTIFSSFKKVAMSEFDKFLKISTIESWWINEVLWIEQRKKNKEKDWE